MFPQVCTKINFVSIVSNGPLHHPQPIMSSQTKPCYSRHLALPALYMMASPNQVQKYLLSCSSVRTEEPFTF